MRISVIIPTYNRENLLRRCLAAATNQDYPDSVSYTHLTLPTNREV